jgi:hypothetical protein
MRCKLAVERVESRDLRCNVRYRTAVVDDVIGPRQARRTGQLRGHDCSDFVGRKSAPATYASHLFLLGTIDDQDAGDTGQQSAALQ